MHYQAIDALGAGLTVEATAPDGVVEAVSARVGDARCWPCNGTRNGAQSANPDSQAFSDCSAAPCAANRSSPTKRTPP